MGLRMTVGEYEIYKARTKRKSTKSKPVVRQKPLGKNIAEKENTGRTFVAITSYRTRLLDRDNLGGGKFLLDALRYSGIICGDSEADIELHVSQAKVKTRKEERTEIEVFK